MRIVFVLGLLAACSDSMLVRQEKNRNGWGEPDILVEPQRLSYGGLGWEDVGLQTFTVTNVGDENSVLALDDVLFADPDAFTLTAPFMEIRLLKDEQMSFTVAFSPLDGISYEDEIVVKSNDANEPATPVFLTGFGLIPKLAITPNPLSFGDIVVGCSKEGEVTLANVGTYDLLVTDLAESEPDIVFSNLPPLPLRLLPGESTTLGVQFTPSDERDYAEALVVGSNDPTGEQEAVQRGAGHLPGAHRHEFTLDRDTPVDIMFVVDQSRSMRDDREALGWEFQDYIARLSGETEDWQIIVVPFDDGCNAGGILTPDTEEYDDIFRDVVDDGEDTTYTEAGLFVADQALMQSRGGACNHGFLRDDALLHIIAVSDEAEQSPNPWDYYVERFWSYKPDPEMVRVSAVAGDFPSGCMTTHNHASPGTGYYEAVTATDGVFLSLCSEWSNSVEALAEAVIMRESYPLAYEPDLDSLDVTVDGRSVAGHWTYRASDNTVVFREGYEPEGGDTVVITYNDPVFCD